MKLNVIVFVVWCVWPLCFRTSSAEFTPIDENLLFQINWAGKSSNLLTRGNEVLLMTTAENEQYKCILPSFDTSNDEEDGPYSGPSALELLRPLFEKSLCTYKLEQYWAYELCHGRHLKQFHEKKEAGKQTLLQEYHLGYYSISKFNKDVAAYETTTAELPADTSGIEYLKLDGNRLPYLSINMTDGTVCDLSGKPRMARIFYVCVPDYNQEIYSLEESSTCEYEVVVLTNLLCAHPEYRLKTPMTNEISCHSLAGETPDKPVVLSELEEQSQQLNPYSKLLDIMKQFMTSEQDEEPDDASGDEKVEVTASSGDKTAATTTSGEKAAVADPVKATETTPYDPKLVQDFLNGVHCLYGGSGWWKFKFCYGRLVEQYHQDADGARTVISLGKWDEDKHRKWLQKYPEKRPNKPRPKYVSHVYSDGDQCKETGKLRYVEVKLRCKSSSNHPNAVTMTLLEPKVCEYVLVVESPILCSLLPKADENGFMQLNDDE